MSIENVRAVDAYVAAIRDAVAPLRDMARDRFGPYCHVHVFIGEDRVSAQVCGLDVPGAAIDGGSGPDLERLVRGLEAKITARPSPAELAATLGVEPEAA